MSGGFAKNVFINCPFDKDYEPLLHSAMFTVVFLGLTPQLASLSADSGSNRLDEIRKLISISKYSIHDLSLAKAEKKGDIFRMNMPFELGLDDGCRNFGNAKFKSKCFLVLEKERYIAKKALSDLAGCDFQNHDGDFQNVIRIVRNWLYNVAGTSDDGAKKIQNGYSDFQEWYVEKKTRVWTQLIQHLIANMYIIFWKLIAVFSNLVANLRISFILQKKRSTILRMA